MRAVEANIAAAWRAYYAVSGGVWKVRTLPCRLRGAIYMALIRPVLVYGLEALAPPPLPS
jgi:hypothetical protein